MKERNDIYLWRVIFTILIVLHHTSFFGANIGMTFGWYLGVEFFFIVSGFLLAEKERKVECSAYRYIERRINTIYPYYFIAFVACVLFIDRGKDFAYRMDVLVSQRLPEMLMIHQMGFQNSTWVNSPDWYISVLLIVSFFAFALLKYNRKLFISIFLPLATIYCLSKCFNASAGLRSGGALYRGISEINIGIALNYICYETDFTLKRCVKKFIEIFSFGAILLTTIKYPNSRWDYIALFLIAVLVYLGFTTESVINYSKNKIVKYINKLCLPVFLNHYFVLYIMSDMNLTISTKLDQILFCVIAIIVVFILSLIETIIITYLSRYIGRYKKLLILEER